MNEPKLVASIEAPEMINIDDLIWFRDQINSRVMPGTMDTAESAYDLIHNLRRDRNQAIVLLRRLMINEVIIMGHGSAVINDAKVFLERFKDGMS